MFRRYCLTIVASAVFAFTYVGCSAPQNAQTTSGGGDAMRAQEAARATGGADATQQGAVSSPLGSLRPHHFCLSVPDFEESILWYEEKLGFKTVRRWEFPEFRTRFAYLELNGYRVEVTAREGSTQVLNPRRGPTDDLQTQGVKHVGLAVDDLDKAVAELKRRGVEVVWEPRFDERSGVKLSFIKDNNGNGIELIEAPGRR